MGTTERSPGVGKDGHVGHHSLLVATGSSGPWRIDVDESGGERDEFFAQIEGPFIYLYFAIPSLQTVRTMRQYLQLRRASTNPVAVAGVPKETEPLRIGTFGQAAVNLVWDDEFVDRCFLKVGVRGPTTLHLTLWGEEIRHLSEALRQAEEDLGESESTAPARHAEG
jgi:hypothetical protein